MSGAAPIRPNPVSPREPIPPREQAPDREYASGNPRAGRWSARTARGGYPERTNFWKHCGVNGARRAAAPEATVTSPT